jgi:hypothetical protein
MNMRISLLWLVVGCGSPEVVSLAVEPGTVDRLGVDGTQSFQAIATFDDDSTEDVTASAEWSSSDDAVASVDAGVVSGVAPGEATVSVRYEGSADELTLEVLRLGPFDVTINGDWSPQHGSQGLTFYARLIDDTDGTSVACGGVVADDAVWSLSGAALLQLDHRYHAEAFADVNGDGLVNDPGHAYFSETTRKVSAEQSILVEHAGGAPDWTGPACASEPPLTGT